MTSLVHQLGPTTLAGYSWSFDAANRVTAKTSPDGAASFQYDAAGQLTGAETPNQTHSHGPTGNRTT